MKEQKLKNILESKEFWGDLPFPEEELHEKPVEFRVRIKWEDSEHPSVTSGTGKFFIRQGLMGFHVEVVVEQSFGKESVLKLTSKQASLIKRQREGSEFEFSLIEV